MALRERQRSERGASRQGETSEETTTTATAGAGFNDESASGAVVEPSTASSSVCLYCPCQSCQQDGNRQTSYDPQPPNYVCEIDGEITMTMSYYPRAAASSSSEAEGGGAAAAESTPATYSQVVRSLADQISSGELKMTRYVGLYTFRDTNGQKQQVTTTVNVTAQHDAGARTAREGASVTQVVEYLGDDTPQPQDSSVGNEPSLAMLEGCTLVSIAQYLNETTHESHSAINSAIVQVTDETTQGVGVAAQQPSDGMTTVTDVARRQHPGEANQENQSKLAMLVAPVAEPLDESHQENQVELALVTAPVSHSSDDAYSYNQPEFPLVSAFVAEPSSGTYGSNHPDVSLMVPPGAVYQHPEYAVEIPSQSFLVQPYCETFQPEAVDSRCYQNTDNEAIYQQLTSQVTNLYWSNYSKTQQTLNVSAESEAGYHVEAPGYYADQSYNLNQVPQEAAFEVDPGYPRSCQMSQFPFDGPVQYFDQQTFVPQSAVQGEVSQQGLPGTYVPPFDYAGHFPAVAREPPHAAATRPRPVCGRQPPGRWSRGKSGGGRPSAHGTRAPPYYSHLPNSFNQIPPHSGPRGPCPSFDQQPSSYQSLRFQDTSLHFPAAAPFPRQPRNFGQASQDGIFGADPWSRPRWFQSRSLNAAHGGRSPRMLNRHPRPTPNFPPHQPRNWGLGICGPHPSLSGPVSCNYPFQTHNSARPSSSQAAVGNPPTSPWRYDRQASSRSATTLPRPLLGAHRTGSDGKAKARPSSTRNVVDVAEGSKGDGDDVPIALVRKSRGSETLDEATENDLPAAEKGATAQSGENEADGDGQASEDATEEESKITSSLPDDSRREATTTEGDDDDVESGPGKEDAEEAEGTSAPPKRLPKRTRRLQKRGLRTWRNERSGNVADMFRTGVEDQSRRTRIHRPWLTPEARGDGERPATPGPSAVSSTQKDSETD